MGDYKERFKKGFKMLCYSKSGYEVWSDLISMFSITISNATTKQNPLFKKVWDEREKEYLRIVNKYDKKQQKLLPQMFALVVQELEVHPNQDLLGALYMGLEISNKNAGQFFTPYNVCEAMTKVTMDRKSIGKQVHKKGYVSFCDPTCGGGATLISCINECKLMFKKLNFQNHTFFVGQDIDLTCVQMCYIQLSLLGVAGVVRHTNTLTDPDLTPTEETLNSYWYTPMYFSPVWETRRNLKKIDNFFGGKNKNEKRTSK